MAYERMIPPLRQGGPPRRDGGAFGQLFLYQLNHAARLQLGIPGMFAMGPDGQIQLTQDYYDAIGYRVKANLVGMVQRTAIATGQKTIDSLTVLAAAMQAESKDSRHLLQAHKILAIEMRNALINRYGQSVNKRKQVPSHRRKNRLSGALGRAIAQPDMAVATPSGINYINQNRLNVEARHWQRINFGVRGAPGARNGTAATKTPEQFDLFGGRGNRSMGKIGFRANPRPPMYLPPGFWMFIGGAAPAGARQRTRRQDLGEDEEDRAMERAEAARKRRQARMGFAPESDKEAVSRDDGKHNSPFYSRNLGGKAKVKTPWGKSYGGYERKRTYTNTYRSTLSSLEPAKGGGVRVMSSYKRSKREVTAVTRGIRRSRQGFFPMGPNAVYPTRGVVASNFMDAGFRALSNNIDRVYLVMAQKIIDDAGDTAAAKVAKGTLVKWRASMASTEINNLLADPIWKQWKAGGQI